MLSEHTCTRTKGMWVDNVIKTSGNAFVELMINRPLSVTLSLVHGWEYWTLCCSSQCSTTGMARCMCVRVRAHARTHTHTHTSVLFMSELIFF